MTLTFSSNLKWVWTLGAILPELFVNNFQYCIYKNTRPCSARFCQINTGSGHLGAIFPPIFELLSKRVLGNRNSQIYHDRYQLPDDNLLLNSSYSCSNLAQKKRAIISKHFQLIAYDYFLKKIIYCLKTRFLGVSLVKSACVRPNSIFRGEKSIFTNQAKIKTVWLNLSWLNLRAFTVGQKSEKNAPKTA